MLSGIFAASTFMQLMSGHGFRNLLLRTTRTSTPLVRNPKNTIMKTDNPNDNETTDESGVDSSDWFYFFNATITLNGKITL